MAISKEEKTVKNDSVVAIKNLPDLTNDPVLVKRRKFASEFIRKHGLPKDFINKKKR